MATHCSVLAWRIPGVGKSGGLPSMGLHRVGHNWSDLAAAAYYAWEYLSLPSTPSLSINNYTHTALFLFCFPYGNKRGCHGCPVHELQGIWCQIPKWTHFNTQTLSSVRWFHTFPGRSWWTLTDPSWAQSGQSGSLNSNLDKLKSLRFPFLSFLRNA